MVDREEIRIRDICWYFRQIYGTWKIENNVIILTGTYRELCSCGSTAQNAYNNYLHPEAPRNLNGCLSTLDNKFCSIEQKRTGICDGIANWCHCQSDLKDVLPHRPFSTTAPFTGDATDAANVQINVDYAFNYYLNSPNYEKICKFCGGGSMAGW